MTTDDTKDANVQDISEHPEYVNAEPESMVAYGVHLVMTNDGQFGIQLSGEPNTGEVVGMLGRALETVRARMTAETVIQLQMAMRDMSSDKRIITPRG